MSIAFSRVIIFVLLYGGSTAAYRVAAGDSGFYAEFLTPLVVAKLNAGASAT